MANAQKYQVVAGGGAGRYGYAPTLAAAKTLGAKIAKQEAWKGKWNLLYISVRILRQNGPGYYKDTGWAMYVPVRGSGKRADYILATIQKREGVTPLRWSWRQSNS